MRLRRAPVAASRLVVFCVLLLSSCAGYHIGPIKPTYMKDIKTVAVPPFKNDTLIPRIEVLVAGSIIKAIQMDGTYDVTSEDNADAIVEGSVTNIVRNPARSLIGNVLVATEYNLVLTLNIRVVKRSNQALLAQRIFTGQTSFFVGQDVNQEERQALPLAVEDAARSAVTALSEGW